MPYTGMKITEVLSPVVFLLAFLSMDTVHVQIMSLHRKHHKVDHDNHGVAWVTDCRSKRDVTALILWGIDKFQGSGQN